MTCRGPGRGVTQLQMGEIWLEVLYTPASNLTPS